MDEHEDNSRAQAIEAGARACYMRLRNGALAEVSWEDLPERLKAAHRAGMADAYDAMIGIIRTQFGHELEEMDLTTGVIGRDGWLSMALKARGERIRRNLANAAKDFDALRSDV